MSKLAFTLKRKIFKTPLGPMMATGDDEVLYSLDFVETRSSSEEESPPLLLIQKELKAYFAGTLKAFKTPLFLQGTPFQKRVWEKLTTIPYGQTWSYTELAEAVGNRSACRAVGGANGANRFAIIVPCHRVINKDGSLGGYASGQGRKQWLLQFENSMLWNR